MCLQRTTSSSLRLRCNCGQPWSFFNNETERKCGASGSHICFSSSIVRLGSFVLFRMRILTRLLSHPASSVGVPPPPRCFLLTFPRRISAAAGIPAAAKLSGLRAT
eukprot:GHVU01149664.1.p2 GENE.GHVU01149664.1~~GHVU01149664.1.p2  ORF type:complete len:106 (+),score=5.27 GHVU01149664.1:38-355(+)